VQKQFNATVDELSVSDGLPKQDGRKDFVTFIPQDMLIASPVADGPL